MELSGEQIERFRDALVAAFLDYAGLKQMLHIKLGKNLVALVGGENKPLKDVAFELIILAQAGGWVLDLITASKKASPQKYIFEKIEKELVPEVPQDIIEEILVEIKEKKKAIVKKVSIESRLDNLFQEIDLFFRSISLREYDWLRELEKFYSTIKSKWDERRFQVAVMALMKSGKSTLLNSWIGNEFLPSAAQAETMKVITIRHTEGKKEGVLRLGDNIVAEGRKNINQYIRQANQEERKLGEQKLANLILDVEMASLKGKKLNGYGFDFLDTPGTNEFGVSSLSAKVEHLIKNSDVIIYLLDYTKLNSIDEKDIFDNLSRWKNELLHELDKRLFFVVNKIDMRNRHDREKKMTLPEIRTYVKKILKSNLDIEPEESSIILVSADRAILGRLVENKSASKEQMEDFKEAAFGEVGAEDATDEECEKAVHRIILNSGFSELEEKILRSIHKNRSQILLKSIFTDLNKFLYQIENNLEVSKGALLNAAGNIEKLKTRIATFQVDVEELNKREQEFKKKALEYVDAKFSNFLKEIRQLMKTAFLDKSGTASKFSWIRLLKDPFGKQYYEIVDVDANSFEEKIDYINNFINMQIDNKFGYLVTDIVNSQYNEFIKFSGIIEKKGSPLVKKIEQAINETLNIILNPGDVHFNQPSLKNFYDSMYFDIEDVMTINEKSNMNFFQKIWNNLVQWLGFEGKEEKIYEEYKLNSNDYEEKVIKTISPVLNEAKQRIKNFITSKYLDAVENAISNITSYSDRYIRIMEKEIDMKKDSDVNIPLRIANMEEDLISVKGLVESLKKMNKKL